MSEIMTLSRTGQLTIPKSVCELVGWKPGDQLVPLVKGRTVTLVKLRPLEDLYGFIKGAKIGEIREREDRL